MENKKGVIDCPGIFTNSLSGVMDMSGYCDGVIECPDFSDGVIDCPTVF